MEAVAGSVSGSAHSFPTKSEKLVLDDQRLRNEYCWFVFDLLSRLERITGAATQSSSEGRLVTDCAIYLVGDDQ